MWLNLCKVSRRTLGILWGHDQFVPLRFGFLGLGSWVFNNLIKRSCLSCCFKLQQAQHRKTMFSLQLLSTRQPQILQQQLQGSSILRTSWGKELATIQVSGFNCAATTGRPPPPFHVKSCSNVCYSSVLSSNMAYHGMVYC